MPSIRNLPLDGNGSRQERRVLRRWDGPVKAECTQNSGFQVRLKRVGRICYRPAGSYFLAERRPAATLQSIPDYDYVKAKRRFE